MRLSNLSVLVTAAAVGLAPVVSQAAPAEDAAGSPDEAFERAEALRLEAIEAYNAGDLETTLEKFKAAYDVDPSPAFLFNVGRVYEEMGELERALDYYEKFARQPRLRLEEREQAAERIEVLRKLVSPDEPAPDEGGSPTTDDPPAPVGEEQDRAAVGPSRPLIVAGASLLGVGAALALGGGLGLGFAARDRSDRVDAVTPGNNPEGLTLSELEDLDAQGRTFEVWQIVTAAGGGAVAVTGAVLLGVGLARRGKAKASAAVRPVFGRGFAGASIRTRF